MDREDLIQNDWEGTAVEDEVMKGPDENASRRAKSKAREPEEGRLAQVEPKHPIFSQECRKPDLLFDVVHAAPVDFPDPDSH